MILFGESIIYLHMMKKFNYAIVSLKKLWLSAGKMAIECGHNRIYYLVDFVLLYMKNNCTLRHYEVGGLYKMKRKDAARALTYKRWEKVVARFNDKHFVKYFDNKYLFNKFFFKWVHREFLYLSESTYEQYLSFLADKTAVVVKPLDNWQGKGIYKQDVRIMQTKGRVLYEQMKAQNCMLEEVVVQHPVMCLSGSSVNTIRVFTFIDSKGRVHILDSVFRIGLGESFVDNFCAGGMVFPLDSTYGFVDGKGLAHDYTKHSFLIGTTYLMMGFQIPHWKDIVDCLMSAALVIPQCRFIGWDIAVTENGIELIEGNHNPDYEFLELVGKHCDYYNLIKL